MHYSLFSLFLLAEAFAGIIPERFPRTKLPEIDRTATCKAALAGSVPACCASTDLKAQDTSGLIPQIANCNFGGFPCYLPAGICAVCYKRG